MLHIGFVSRGGFAKQEFILRAWKYYVKRTNEHTHAPNEQDVSCCETKAGIKRRARESQDSSHHIVSESVQIISEGTATKLPKLDSLKRTIQRERANMLAAPVQPATLDQLALPDEYQKMAMGEQFLLYDCGAGDAQRFLIFGTQNNLQMLQSSRCWLADGTFKTASSLFAQVYVVHGLRGGPDLAKDGHLLPSLFVLLANKTEAIYKRMWEQIRILCPYAQPQSMLLDFEKAAINSFQQVWPHTVVKCCFFHLTQNFWRKVQAVGLQADYSNDEDLAMRIRQYPLSHSYIPLMYTSCLTALHSCFHPLPKQPNYSTISRGPMSDAHS